MAISESMMALLSLAIIMAFITSFFKWARLIYHGRRPFGPTALVPTVPRPRPFWNAAHFVVFYAFVIIFSVILTGIAGAMGYIDFNSETTPQESTAEVISKTIDPVPKSITVAQLLISSFSMLAAMLATIAVLNFTRPKVGPISADESVTRRVPGFGWVPRVADIKLGFVAAWLILPPTMVMMGLVSAIQAYSHPVLEALRPSDPSLGPNFAIFAALFFTTALVTPVVEEFWFRGILQGGLQRLADARSDAVRWGMVRRSTPAAAALTTDTGNPYQSPAGVESFSTPSPDTETAFDEQPRFADPATRSDWTPTAIWPIVVASLLFAVMHWGQGLAPIPLFFLSLGLGYLYRQTGSLIPSIIVHFVLNGFTMSATLLEMLR